MSLSLSLSLREGRRVNSTCKYRSFRPHGTTSPIYNFITDDNTPTTGLFRICFLYPFYLATQHGAEWGRKGNVGPLFFVRPPPSHSPSSPRSRATKKWRHAALPGKTAKENRSERTL
jgi:hypothetical protein